MLYCSRARGDARPDSDYDVAVFLRDMDDPEAELWRLADLSSSIVDETGDVVHAMPYPTGAYNERTPLMREIRREGVEALHGIRIGGCPAQTDDQLAMPSALAPATVLSAVRRYSGPVSHTPQ